MDTGTEKRIQENRRQVRVEKMNLEITKSIVELLKIAAVKDWGDGTTVEVKIKNGTMEEVL